jgi:hypothetical protein
LSADVFSASTDDSKKGKATKGTGQGATLKAKEAMLQKVADSMAATLVFAKNRQAKRSEKMQLERDIGSYEMNLVQLPESAMRAQTFFKNAKIEQGTARIEAIEAFFENNPSPCKK